MLLCDVGNTSYYFFDGITTFKERVGLFDPSTIEERVYYINVNPSQVSVLSSRQNWIDLEPLVERDRFYIGMGIDRIILCEAIEHGLVIDAGSAITVDAMKHGHFVGGFIYPGMVAMRQAYAQISARLDIPFNFEVDLAKMPTNSKDAISYGFLRTLYSEVIRHDGPLYITGGDADSFATLFPEAHIDPLLIFKGMRKFIPKG